jgi:hypothetical protein
MGAGIVLHGHGLRDRQVRGPLSPGTKPVEVIIRARRYQCQECGAVSIVVPLGVAGRRLYSLMAIGLALFLWSTMGLSSPVVRTQCSPWKQVGPSAMEGWVQLRRWGRAFPSLFPKVRGPATHSGGVRGDLVTGLAALAAFAPPGMRSAPESAQVFTGAALAG